MNYNEILEETVTHLIKLTDEKTAMYERKIENTLNTFAGKVRIGAILEERDRIVKIIEDGRGIDGGRKDILNKIK